MSAANCTFRVVLIYQTFGCASTILHAAQFRCTTITQQHVRLS
jgi:hypothetical protein